MSIVKSKYSVGDQVRVLDPADSALSPEFKGRVLTVVLSERETIDERRAGGRATAYEGGHAWWYRDIGVELVEGPW